MFEYGFWNIWTCAISIMIVYAIYQIILIEFFIEHERFVDPDIKNTKTHLKDVSLAVIKAEEALHKLLGTTKIGIVTLNNYKSSPTTFSFDVKIYDYNRHVIQNYYVSLKKPAFKGDYIVDKLENTDNITEIENGSFDIINSAEYSGLNTSV